MRYKGRCFRLSNSSIATKIESGEKGKHGGAGRVMRDLLRTECFRASRQGTDLIGMRRITGCSAAAKH
jgi:hypothetical protein